ncbi:MAG TPA: RHS repeat-associated core domain-containing protein [Candidatus Sulfotelmatobacter sp.]|nr:RHS repeat-associated core domain-containing protein [Candidatus Sulfotelmatobacter sp.]
MSTTNYLYDGANIVEEIDGGGSVLAKFAQGSHVDEWLAELQPGGTSYYEEDGVDSVSSLSNLSGALANTYTFDSFGKLTGSTGTFVNPFQYTSREFDPETGIFYRARHYDQSSGRFISEDPIGFGAGTHFYKHARNNPVLLNDPFGLWVNTGTPAPPDTNTIVCNGLGGIMVQIGINQDLPCGLATCIWEHEERHWKDAIAANPGVCH